MLGSHRDRHQANRISLLQVLDFKVGTGSPEEVNRVAELWAEIHLQDVAVVQGAEDKS